MQYALSGGHEYCACIANGDYPAIAGCLVVECGRGEEARALYHASRCGLRIEYDLRCECAVGSDFYRVVVDGYLSLGVVDGAGNGNRGYAVVTPATFEGVEIDGQRRVKVTFTSCDMLSSPRIASTSITLSPLGRSTNP